MNFGYLDIGNLQMPADTTPVITPADSIVIPDAQYPDVNSQVVDDTNWFDELMSDTSSLIIIAIVFVLTFGICFILFIMIFNEKAARDKIKKKRD